MSTTLATTTASSAFIEPTHHFFKSSTLAANTPSSLQFLREPRHCSLSRLFPPYPIENYISTANVSLSHAAFVSNISKYCKPSSFEEANSQSVWRDAMREELQALDENCTWSIVKLPQGKRAVGCKWVYKTKFKSDGSLERHKARLVAKGFTQTFRVDYKETFAPAAKMNIVGVLLSVAVNNDWPLFQMDVKNAFLHGELEEEVYMSLPPEHPQEKQEGMVCKLHKAIYGLKQSPRAWMRMVAN
ncbi:hypothetical protein L3X38_003792 [Prunus dulcis]|uniref:Reverse transcriptase Ty1/copia-type domain-containing protein n=1 Tax=Prunus dulcis TaxID=3755 RepID=A0AAD4ZMS3_PRUDU|nr:hypothetical protein L3X38_003792 [Prunus dulcis]